MTLGLNPIKTRTIVANKKHLFSSHFSKIALNYKVVGRKSSFVAFYYILI